MVNHIKTLVFDLDDTLYPASLGYNDYSYGKVYEFVNKRIGLSFEKYRNLVIEYTTKYGSAYDLYKKFGTSFEEYITYVCEHDMSKVEYNEELEKKLLSLPHKKIVYTDANRKHTIDTLKQLRLENILGDIYTVKEAGYVWKSYQQAFQRFLDFYNLNPKETIIFEDNLKNIKRAKEAGLTTALIAEKGSDETVFCDYVFPNINKALEIFQNK